MPVQDNRALPIGVDGCWTAVRVHPLQSKDKVSDTTVELLTVVNFTRVTDCTNNKLDLACIHGIIVFPLVTDSIMLDYCPWETRHAGFLPPGVEVDRDEMWKRFGNIASELRTQAKEKRSRDKVNAKAT